MEYERKAFEAKMSDNGEWPKAIERTPYGHYKLMQTAQAWLWWQHGAAWQRLALNRQTGGNK